VAIRYFALIYGIVFLLIGIAGFIPGFVVPFLGEHPPVAVDAGAGLLFGLFPVNVLHNIVHALFGLWGIAVWRSMPASRTYARAVAVIYGIFVIMGFLPVLNTTFGLVPLWGHDIWLHAVLAGVAAYFGFVARPGEAAATPVTEDRVR
jgi:hypothetical protein